MDAYEKQKELYKVQEKSFVPKELKKRYRFNGYVLTDIQEDEEITHFYNCFFEGKEIELKVTFNDIGHWTDFIIEKKDVYRGQEDFFTFDSFETYIK